MASYVCCDVSFYIFGDFEENFSSSIDRPIFVVIEQETAKLVGCMIAPIVGHCNPNSRVMILV